MRYRQAFPDRLGEQDDLIRDESYMRRCDRMHADLASDPVPTARIRADAAQPFLAGIGVGGDHEVDRTVVPTGDMRSGRTRLEAKHVLSRARIKVGRTQRVLALLVEHPIDRVAGSGE